MRCSKIQDGTAVIDIIPKVRYRIPVFPVAPSLELLFKNPQLFESGLIVHPEMAEDNTIRTVVILNVGERSVRLSSRYRISGVNEERPELVETPLEIESSVSDEEPDNDK
jgi:hypothetical protein